VCGCVPEIDPMGTRFPGERTPEKRREAAAAVERALVEVMYLTARTYEHSPSLLQRIGEKIRAAGFENLAGSVLLLKF
jgi:hypothetical protein